VTKTSNWTRLEKLEARAPAPYDQHTILWTPAHPDPNGGPPINGGVTQRWCTVPHRDGTVEVFEPECPENLLPPELTPAQVAQVLEHRDACGPRQNIQVNRRADGSGTIVGVESGREPVVLMELLQ
jgi:hypothetical protein